jgi:hypothetical protein
MKHYECRALVTFALGVVCSAQTTSSSANFSVDLSRYYFKMPAEEVAARAELNAATRRQNY